ncbi:MAG TPA: glycosyltransferase family 39 protein, partial [Candidatus Nitrosotenuis sp.]|nr:glycosyltransferase family 39 protein [Candidatus Nitrosotenuis sp.]
MTTHPTRQPAEERTPWGWLALFTVASAVLCSIHLDRGLWLDEYYTLIRSIRRPLGEILTIFPGDTQHMLHAVLARIFVVLFGEHAWTIRLPAVMFGVGAVPALYFCAREMTSRREALLGSALLTVSYHHVWFSQNARGYTGMLFFTLLSTYFLLRGLKSGERKLFVWYAVCAALGVFAHLTTVFLIAAHALVSAAVLWLPGWREEKFQVKDWRAPL